MKPSKTTHEPLKKTSLDRLINRYIQGQVSSEEKLRIDAWLAKLGQVRDEDFWLEIDEEEILFQKITGNASLDEVLTYPPRVMNRKLLRTKYWIITAAATLASLIILFLWTK